MLNTWEFIICFCFECIYECMRIFFLKMPDNFAFSIGEWIHECIYECMVMHETLLNIYPFEWIECMTLC